MIDVMPSVRVNVELGTVRVSDVLLSQKSDDLVRFTVLNHTKRPTIDKKCRGANLDCFRVQKSPTNY